MDRNQASVPSIERLGKILRDSLDVAVDLFPLKRTGNNRCFRAAAGDKAYFVKVYHRTPDDFRDRFGAERAFYRFLAEARIAQVPADVQWIEEHGIGVFDFVDGRSPESATPEFIWQALDFFCRMNLARTVSSALPLPAASEACFSLKEHMTCVERRIFRLRNIQPGTALHEAARDFVQRRLAPAWNRLREILESHENSPVLAKEERCISPSDFGLHNALVGRDGKLCFHDFEYAGWDDPAKTVCDFFCQPAAPIPLAERPGVVELLKSEFEWPQLPWRIEKLMPVYRLKWCCILLNEFLPMGEARRQFSHPEAEIMERREAQLEKTKACFDRFLSAG